MKFHLLAGTSLLVVGSCISAASATPVNFDFTGSIVEFTVANSGFYDITAVGAQGGNAHIGTGGLGASAEGLFNLTAGTVLEIAVGGQGGNSNGAGGGGGTFVVEKIPNGVGGYIYAPLVIGGGGGGAEYSGNGEPGLGLGDGGAGANYFGGPQAAGGSGGGGGMGGFYGYSGYYSGGGGGGGFYTNGGSEYGAGGGLSFLNGLAGGSGVTNGEFGGGGAGGYGTSGGGGGGYNGGGGGNRYSAGGGGSSFDVGSQAVVLSGVEAGDGFATINPIPEPGTLGLLASALGGVGVIRRRKRR